MRVPAELHHEHRHRRLVATRLGSRRARVVVDGHAEVLARRPDRVVVGRDQRGEIRVRRHAGEEDAAEEVVLSRPLDLGDRVVDVVEEDLRHARPPARRVGTEVGHPAVVCLEPGPTQLVVLGRRAPARAGCPDGKNGGMVFGKSTSATTPSSSSSCSALRRVPVAVGGGGAQVVPRVHVGLRPLVELVEVLRLEVLAVLVHLRAGVAVGRDDDVAVTGERGHRYPRMRTDVRWDFSGRDSGLIARYAGRSRIATTPAFGTHLERSGQAASRSQVSLVTPSARSSCLRTRMDASVRGRSSTTSHVARQHEARHPRLEEREQRGGVERRQRRARSPRPAPRPRRARAGTPIAAHSSTVVVLGDRGLDLERRDVLAAPPDRVAHAVDEVVPAVLVDAERVAGVEPAVAPRRRPSAPASCSSPTLSAHGSGLRTTSSPDLAGRNRLVVLVDDAHLGPRVVLAAAAAVRPTARGPTRSLRGMPTSVWP